MLDRRPRPLPSSSPVLRRALVAACTMLAAVLTLVSPAAADLSQSIVTRNSTEPVAPGVQQREYQLFGPGGFVDAHVLEVRLGTPGISADVLDAGSASSAAPISQQARKAGAIAGVNASYFDINNSNAPLGTVVKSDEFLVGSAEVKPTVGLTRQGLGQIASASLDAAVALPGPVPGGTEKALSGLNAPGVAVNGIAMYTAFWGGYDRARLVGSSTNVREVVVRGGQVESVRTGAGAGGIPRDGFVLVGRDEGADALAGLKEGDRVSVRYRPRLDGSTLPAPAPFGVAVSGNTELVRDGEVVEKTTDGVAARAAVGFSPDARTMYIATADKLQGSTPGLTRPDMGELMDRLGADDAINVDGGGSATVAARRPGRTETEAGVVNVPSDGSERPVPNGLGIFLAPGDGQLSAIELQPLGGDDAERIFPGLRRRFATQGYDRATTPVDAGPVTLSVPEGRGSAEGDLVRAGERPGALAVTASAGGVEGTEELRVLGALRSLEAVPGRVAMAAADAPAESLRVTGADDEGFTAPVDPADLGLDYDESVVGIAPGEDGRLRVTPKREGATLLELRVGKVSTRVPVTVGLDTVQVSDFEDLSPFNVTNARAPGASAAVVDDGRTGKAIELTYDFTQSTGTRTAGLAPKAALTLPGQPRALSFWVDAEGKGEWASATIVDAAGKATNLYSPDLFTPGWQKISFNLPPSGVQYPVRISGIRAIETSAAAQYKSTMAFDDLEVSVPPPLEVPVAPLEPDPVVDADGELPGDRWQFATLSDIQFTANDSPLDRQLIQVAREQLREIVEEKPDFLVINGDFVDTGYAKDMELAKKILDEELGGKLPYHYVPGNHELLGPGNLTAFEENFGAAYKTFDHKGVRFLTLNSAPGTLRAGGFGQLAAMRVALDEAERDPAIKRVVVFAHHPAKDPDPAANSQLGDAKETRLVEQWLAGFHARSGGKGALMVGSHAQIANVRRLNGVQYMVLPAAGKGAYGTPDRGGFNGRVTYAVDTGEVRANRDWIVGRVRVDAERLEVQGPETIGPDAPSLVTGRALQPRGGDWVPLRYPASAKWIGSPTVAVAPAAPDGDDLARFDPETGELRSLDRGAGTVELTVEADGKRASRIVAVGSRPAESRPPAEPWAGPGPGGQTPLPVTVPPRSRRGAIRNARPALTRLSVRSRPGRLRLSYRLSEPAMLRLQVTRTAAGRRSGASCRAPSPRNRRGLRCTRTVVVATRRLSARGGVAARTVALRLKRGRYRVAVQATDADGGRSAIRRVRLRVARG